MKKNCASLFIREIRQSISRLSYCVETKRVSIMYILDARTDWNSPTFFIIYKTTQLIVDSPKESKHCLPVLKCKQLFTRQVRSFYETRPTLFRHKTVQPIPVLRPCASQSLSLVYGLPLLEQKQAVKRLKNEKNIRLQFFIILLASSLFQNLLLPMTQI